jgi:hypothetical protein
VLLGPRFFLRLSIFENSRKLRLNLKLGPRCLDGVLNSVSAFCYYIAHPAHFSFIFFQPTISLKSSLLLFYELPTENLFFDRSRADPYSLLSSHQYCKFFFLFGLLIFIIKLNTLTVGFIVHNVQTKMLLINIYHGGQILNTSTGVGYDIRVACIFSTDETINLRDLKRRIHTGLELLSSQFNINISARINTAPNRFGWFFYSLFGVVSDEIWGMIKITAPY